MLKYIVQWKLVMLKKLGRLIERKPVDIRPWAKGRNSFKSSILSEGANSQSMSSENLTPADLEARTDLMASSVAPVWESNSGHSDIETANQIVTLLLKLTRKPDKQDSVRLYQLLFTDWYTHFGTWRQLDTEWNELEFAKSQFLFHFFLDWAEEAPDVGPVDAALFFLARTNKKPPMTLTLELGRNRFLAAASASVIAAQYDADEDALIKLAAIHGFGAREQILSFLRIVSHPENKEWLLTKGYDSGAEYHPCGYYAAIHGDLLSRLQHPEVTPEMLYHYGCIIADMCQAAGGDSAWKCINDYNDAPEAIGLFFNHVRVQNAARSLPSQLSEILWFLHFEQSDEDAKGSMWGAGVSEALYESGRSFFMRPFFDEEAAAHWLYWEQTAPTIEDLKERGHSVFYDVLEAAKESADHQDLSEIVSWAIDSLALTGDKDTREVRKNTLLAEPMPGVCSGGIAGLTDPNLGSVYGQILLQMAQALNGRSPMGLPLLTAALETNYPHLPEVAMETLRQWPQELLPSEVRAILQNTGNDDP